jgi:hypothetical protein
VGKYPKDLQIRAFDKYCTGMFCRCSAQLL